LVASGVGTIRSVIRVAIPSVPSDPRFDDDTLVVEVHVEDPAHAAERDQQAVFDRQRPARESGPRATGHPWHVQLVAGAQHLFDLFRAARQDGHRRHHVVMGQAVGGVCVQLVAMDEHLLIARDSA
jgi:hypothetical protein